MPRIFRTIDAEMKEHYANNRTEQVAPFLPPGLIDPSTSWVQSLQLVVPGRNSTITIRGKLDTVVRFDDATYGVIDFKTSGVRSESTNLYGRQLHAYAFALENADDKFLSLAPVRRLGLIVFEPTSFSSDNNALATLSGPLKWVEVPRNDQEFFAFLRKVVDVLELPTPPPSSSTCEWCQYREKSRITGL